MSGDERQRTKLIDTLREVLDTASELQEQHQDRNMANSFIVNELERRGYFLGAVERCAVCGALSDHPHLHAKWHRRGEPKP